jgi:AraC family transcriptional regulator, regulatory protein of adaptative response / methylated-DNA-[protein]-cysteine methyltransferase
MNTPSQTTNSEDLWQAVQVRDAAYDGAFVYAVRSTGIYCRPSCASRRPRREQVVFFTTPEDAEGSGFRPCRRCRPQQVLSQNEKTALVSQVCALIDAHIEQPPSLAELSQDVHLSPAYLHRLFKAVTGLTPRQYAAGQRLGQFKAGVKAGQDVTTALYAAGYSSSSRLYEDAVSRLGMTPAVYRRGGKGLEIAYTTVPTRLGSLLAAATPRGICAVYLGEEEALLETILKAEFPSAVVRRDDAALLTWVSVLVRYLEGIQPALDLPLDLQATAFQLRVWEELRKIPYGETRSYSAVAEAIGNPKAVRAVAQACAANPAALVTPCHRVVRQNGELGGYRWGIERKKELLKLEIINKM